MSYQEKNIAISLCNGLLIFAFYLVSLFQMYQADAITSLAVFSLWGTIIVVAIITSIVSSILGQIALGILTGIRTRQEEPLFIDERDKLIELKGTRNSYAVTTLGIFISMLAMVADLPMLVTFNLLIASIFLAEIMGDVSRLYMYRRGF